jgi:FkbM family methyltransferase
MPRGRTRLALYLMRHGPAHEVAYTDQWGYRRAALLTDRMEAYAYTGVRALPRNVDRLIRPGDWVIDVGANVGLVTAHLCRRTGPHGRVWAIEPVPRNVARLQQLKELNRLDHLTVFQGALSAAGGPAELRLPAGGQSAYASFTKSSDMSGSIEVTTWRLDDLVYEARDDRRVACVKIDVEGYEPQVIAGAERTLREMKPLLYCEFNDILLRDAGSSADQLLQTLAQLGYRPVGSPPSLTGRVVDLLLAADR